LFFLNADLKGDVMPVISDFKAKLAGEILLIDFTESGTYPDPYAVPNPV